MTLTRLCLCNQNITVMEGLQLPNLKQLLLQQNQITKIEALEGYVLMIMMMAIVLTDQHNRCPKLQKLWLYSNKIKVIENLHQ